MGGFREGGGAIGITAITLVKSRTVVIDDELHLLQDLVVRIEVFFAQQLLQ